MCKKNQQNKKLKRKTKEEMEKPIWLPANKVILLANNNENYRMMKLTSEEHARK